MSDYYLGDPCYVIPDDEWGDFCNIIRDDGEDFEYKGETCRVIGTGGDGDFGGLSVDAGIIGVIPVSLCDPDELESIVKSNDGRLINNFATLEEQNGIIIIDDEAINGQQCECNYCRGSGEWFSEDNMTDCDSCGCILSHSCVEEGDEGGYCSSWCKEEAEPEDDEE